MVAKSWYMVQWTKIYLEKWRHLSERGCRFRLKSRNVTNMLDNSVDHMDEITPKWQNFRQDGTICSKCKGKSNFQQGPSSQYLPQRINWYWPRTSAWKIEIQNSSVAGIYRLNEDILTLRNSWTEGIKQYSKTRSIWKH